MKIRSIGIDLGKTTFHLVPLGERGKTVIKKKLSRKQLLTFTANLQPSLIGLEACSGSHCLGHQQARKPVPGKDVHPRRPRRSAAPPARRVTDRLLDERAGGQSAS